MSDLVISVPDDLRARLDALAAQTGRSVEQCLELAVMEFIETWEVHLRDVAEMEDSELRAVLKAVNE